jgi:hypothetical protein
MRYLAFATTLLVSTSAFAAGAGMPWEQPLQQVTGPSWSGLVVQAFSPDLLKEVCIRSVPLPNADIRRGEAPVMREDRINRIVTALGSAIPPFRLDPRDSLALTLIDGLSSCENYFMEAVYRSGHFPCL